MHQYAAPGLPSDPSMSYRFVGGGGTRGEKRRGLSMPWDPRQTACIMNRMSAFNEGLLLLSVILMRFVGKGGCVL